MAKKKPEVRPSVPALAPNPDLAVITATSATIGTFLDDLQNWLVSLEGLNAEADVALARAKAMPAPTDATSDELTQRYIRSTAEEVKVVEAKANELAEPLHKLHKLVTGRRGAITAKLEDAKRIYQQHHNGYVAAERKRVDEENERRRRAAEAEERERRRLEAERLEAEQLEAEATLEGLSDRERKFVEHYAVGGNAIRAAQAAGYSDPMKQATRLIGTPKIVKALRAAADKASAEQQRQQLEEAPLEAAFEAVEADVVKAPGAKDRTTRSAEVFDDEMFLEAVIGGKHKIPLDTIEPAQVRLNQYARDLGKLINKWPGVRLVEKTTTV